MATTLQDYYSGLGQSLPSLQDRAGVASKAGITDYSGTADQNKSLLGYLQNTPPAGGTGTPVLTSDNLTATDPIKVNPPADTTSGYVKDTNATIGSLLDSTGKSIKQDQATYDATSKDLVQTILASGDQTSKNEAIYKAQGVDDAKRLKDTLVSQITQEQKATADQITALQNSPDGLTGGVQQKIGLLQRESANKLANLGIALAGATNNYQTASDIATRQITANADNMKAQIQAKQFVLEQLGTKLATQKSQAFTLQTKAIDNETDQLNKAITSAKDGAEKGTIDPKTAFQAIADLSAGKISISDFYNQIGDPQSGIINGYDISKYATDPTHEQKVASIYNTMDDITDDKSADAVVKSLTPNTKITGTMVMNASNQFSVDPKLVIAIMQQDSSLGTKGLGAKNNNPGNIGQFDNLGTKGVKGYPTLQAGVDAVAKWLSKNKATGRYNNEFASTIANVALNSSPTVANQKAVTKSLQQAIGNGDYKSAYTQIINNVSKTLTGDNKTQFDAKRIAIPAVEDLEAKLKAYEDAGGKTGLLKGKYEDIQANLGKVNDPKFKALATDLKISLQRYRKDMSGAAFSEQEAKDYASVNPAGSNSLALNLSIISGMKDNFNRQVNSTVDAFAGEGAQYIRDYAQKGTAPNTPQATTPTPLSSGNEFTYTLTYN